MKVRFKPIIMMVILQSWTIRYIQKLVHVTTPSGIELILSFYWVNTVPLLCFVLKASPPNPSFRVLSICTVCK